MRNPVIDVATSYGKIDIGKQGENLTNTITFDCTAWLDGLTGGVLSLVHQRPGDDDAYPVANYTPSDTALLWQPNETDLAFAGIGQCELRYTIGSAIAKSKTFLTVIERGLAPLSTPPEAYEPYIDRVIDAARQEIEAMTVSASATRGDSASASVEKSIEDDHENLAFSFVLPKGDKGDKGDGVPADPASDGDYVLACSKASGAVSTSWSNRLSVVDNLLLADKELVFVRGAINNSGANATNARWIRTNDYYQFNGDKIRLTVKSVQGCTVYVRIFRYDSSKTYVSRNHWKDQTVDIEVRPDYYYRFMVYTSEDEPVLYVEDADDYYALRVYADVNTDKALNKDGRAADALAVGNIIRGEDESLYHIITVKKDGTGDYTSLRPAVDSITDASKNNPYLIEIYPGTYDVMDDFTNDEILAYADASVRLGGIVIGDGINLRGIGDMHTVILNGYLPTTYDQMEIRNKVSTLSIGGNAFIENLTLIAENIRYCIHDSYPLNIGKYKRVLKNVAMIAHKLTSGNPEKTYGCGFMAPGQDSYFENVDFGTDSAIHSNLVATESTITIFKNCRGGMFVINPYSSYAVEHTFFFDGCSFESIKLLEDDTTNAQNMHIYVNGGSSDMLVNALPGRVVMTGDVVKIRKSTLPIGTAVKMDNYLAAKAVDYDIAYGIIINQDDDYTYVQRSGYILSDYIGMSLSEGDYVTLDADSKLTTTGATSSNAVGVAVAYRSSVYIRMRGR